MPRNHWSPDESSPTCTDCAVKFSFFVRRHHCRKCGLIFCNKCSSERVPLAPTGSPPTAKAKVKRVCKACFIERRRTMVGLKFDDDGEEEEASGETVEGILAKAMATVEGGGGGGSSPSSSIPPPTSTTGATATAPPSPTSAGSRPSVTGITLAGVKAFMASCGEGRFRNITTGDVLARNSLFVPVICELFPDHCGPAQVWVSHPWGGRWAKLVEGLEAWESRRVGGGGGAAPPASPPPPTYFYIDLLCASLSMGPHTTSVTESYLYSTLPRTLGSVPTTLLLLDGEGRALKRAWCLYEALTCPHLEVTMAPEDEKALGVALGTLPMDKLLGVYGSCDFTKAEAGRVDEGRRILLAVRGGALGVVQGAARIERVLRGFLLDRALALLPPGGVPECEFPTSNLLLNVALLHHACGETPKALPLLGSIHMARTVSLGGGHPDTIAATLELARVHRENGDVLSCETALTVGLEAAMAGEVGSSSHGSGSSSSSSNSSTTTTSGSSNSTEPPSPLLRLKAALASCLLQQADTSKASQAEPMLRDVYQGYKASLGATHPDTLEIMGKLATALGAQGEGPKGVEAWDLFKQALEGCEGALGECHEVTVRVGDGFGALLLDKGEFDAGETFLAQRLVSRRRTLGDKHPHTLTTLLGVGRAKACMGDVEGAIKVLSEALAADVDIASSAVKALVAVLGEKGSADDAARIQALIPNAS